MVQNTSARNIGTGTADFAPLPLGGISGGSVHFCSRRCRFRSDNRVSRTPTASGGDQSLKLVVPGNKRFSLTPLRVRQVEEKDVSGNEHGACDLAGIVVVSCLPLSRQFVDFFIIDGKFAREMVAGQNCID